ncbi:MAG: sigma-70 family RNA polymerase sigma factor [Pirellulaceae bacterium]
MEKTPATANDWMLPILAEFQPRLQRYALRLLPGHDDLAADAVQHAFQKLASVEQRDDIQQLGPWLYAVCRNRAFDELRRLGRTTQWTNESEAMMSTTSAPAEKLVTDQDCQSFLQTLIDGLPGSQREALDLWSGGMSYAEISQIMSRTEGNIRVLVHRGLEQLRRHPEVTRWLASDP